MTASAPQIQYTQALAKGGALLPETRTLLRMWTPGETEARFAERILAGDLLGRATARRVLDIVRVFALRFLTPTDRAARLLKFIVDAGSLQQCFSDLVLFYAAQRDPLLRDFLTTRFWPSVLGGQMVISNREMQLLIREAEHDGRIPARWSEEIVRDMAGRVMIALTDFGLVRQLKPGVREIAHYRLSDGAAVYLAHLLHEDGVSDQSLAHHPVWSWFGLAPSDVLSRFDELAGQRWFVVQRAGQVVRITWSCASLEEAVIALAG